MFVHSPIGILEILFDEGKVCAVRLTGEERGSHDRGGNREPSAPPHDRDPHDRDPHASDPHDHEPSAPPHASDIERRVAAELGEYFAGTRRQFTVSCAPPRGTRFAERVWAELLHVKYGDRVSYSRLAAMCGVPRAVRAVAHAVATNPLPIFIPCHRVVRKDGSIGEYGLHSVGRAGRDIKKHLLELEARATTRATA